MRMAAEHSLDLSRIQGTGLGGRVTKKDVEAYLSGQGRARTAAAAPGTPELEPWEQPGSGDLFKPTDEIFRQANAGQKQRASSHGPGCTAVPARRASIWRGRIHAAQPPAPHHCGAHGREQTAHRAACDDRV